MMRETAALFSVVEAECPGFQARATSRALTRYYNARFKPLDLTAEQFSLLVGIGATATPTLKDLAVRAGVDKSTLSRSVQNLQRRHLIDEGGGQGRGGKRLALTETGYQKMEAATAIWTEAKAELEARLGASNLRSAHQAMSDLATMLDEMIAENENRRSEDN